MTSPPSWQTQQAATATNWKLPLRGHTMTAIYTEPKAAPLLPIAAAWWQSLGDTEQQRTRAWNRLLREGAEWPCAECGKFGTSTTPHTLQDCEDYKLAMKLSEITGEGTPR
jgi:hypothetical protein